MNTLIFQDELERQYFIEDLHIRGFIKDNKQSNDYAFSYKNPTLPAYRIVVHRSTLAADIYRNDNLLLDDKQSAKDNTTLAA